MNCFLFFLFDLVMTVLALGGVTLAAGKGQMEVGGIVVTLSGTAIFVIVVWLAFFFLC